MSSDSDPEYEEKDEKQPCNNNFIIRKTTFNG